MLEFDSRDGRYHGQWSDGRKFSVNADVFSETVRDWLTAVGFSPVSDIPNSYGEQAMYETSLVETWTDDMDGVTVEEETK